MSALGLTHPAWLAGLALALWPFWSSGRKFCRHPAPAWLPADAVGVGIDWSLRLIAAAAVVSLVLAAAGLYIKAQKIERLGRGAHLMVLIDRSSSMDYTFAGRVPAPAAGRGAQAGEEESKAAAARRLLAEFVRGRQNDLIGIVEYSTSPLLAMPLTDNKAAVAAAIAATDAPALAYTHVAKGLAMALSNFPMPQTPAARAIILISDGAAAIDRDSEQKLRQWFKEKQVALYWIFLRTAGSPGLNDQPLKSADDNPEAMPEKYLHQFFLSLGVPYQAYQAENPKALTQAMNDLDRLNDLPMSYAETIPRRDLARECLNMARLCLTLLIAGKFLER